MAFFDFERMLSTDHPLIRTPLLAGNATLEWHDDRTHRKN